MSGDSAAKSSRSRLTKAQLIEELERLTQRNRELEKAVAQDARAGGFEDHLRRLFDDFNHGILIHRHHRPLYANKALAQIYGYKSPKEFQKLKTIRVLLHPDSKKRIPAERHRKRLAGEIGTDEDDVKCLRRDGAEIWVNRRVMVIDWQGEPAALSIQRDITDRMKAEAALLESRAALERERSWLRGATDSFTEGFALFDADDRLVICNNNYRAAMDDIADMVVPGVTFEEIITARMKRDKRKDNVKRDKTWIRERVKRHRNPKGPQERIYADGRAVQIHEFKTRDGGIAVIRTDITDLKNAEQSLRAAEAENKLERQRLIDAIESLSGGFAYYGKDDRLVICNENYRRGRPGMEDVFVPGTTFEGYLRERVRRGILTDDQVRDEAWIRGRLKRHRNPKGPMFRKLKDGRVIQLNEYKTSDGGTVILRTDITDIKKAEAEAQESRTELKLILDNMVEGVVTIDVKGVVEYVNSNIENMFGYAPGEIIGKNVKMLMPEPYRKEHDGYLANYKKTGRGKILGIGREVPARRKDGTVFPVDLSVSKIETGGGVKFVGTLHDLTEHKKVEDELNIARLDAETASRVKSEFLAVVSHELRTPLNAVIGFSGSLLEGIFGAIVNERHESYIQDIHDSGTHLLHLIDDILDVSVIESEKMTLQDDEIQVREMAASALRLVQPRAEAGQVELSCMVEDADLALRADERRLRQILLNLLSNSVKFTPAGGKVSLRAHAGQDRRVTFTVSDNGIGMNQADISKALEPFGQVHSAHTRKYEGVGLGLPLAAKLAKLHGGTLEIRSKKNKGTTIAVSFPAERTISVH